MGISKKFVIKHILDQIAINAAQNLFYNLRCFIQRIATPNCLQFKYLIEFKC